MTETLIENPGNISYGIVTARFARDIKDGEDIDDIPEYVALAGTVTFTMSVSKTIDAGATPAPVIFGRDPIVCKLDPQGYLCSTNDFGEPMYRWVKLEATDDPDLNPTNFTWIVSYDLRNSAGKKMKGFDSHEISVPTGSTQDLANAIEPDGAQSIGIPQANALAAAAALSSAEAEARAIAAEAAATSAAESLLDSAQFVGDQLDDEDSPARQILDPLVSAKNVALSTDDDGPIVGFNDDRYAPANDVSRAGSSSRKMPPLTMVSDMTSGWSVGNALSSNLNDTSDFIMGTRSVSMTTRADSTLCAAQYDLGSAQNLSTKGVIVWLKYDSGTLADLAQFNVDLATDSGYVNRVRARLSDLSNEKYPIKIGEWYPLQLSNAMFRLDGSGTPDWASLRYLRVVQYGAAKAVPWRVGGFAFYDEASTTFPNGAVSITVDESTSGIMGAARALAAKGWAATHFPIQDRIGQAGWPTMQNVKDLQNVFGWDIGAHASTTATHVDYRTLTAEQIKSELRTMRRWQQENGLNSDVFAYPVGPYNIVAADCISAVYDSARGTATVIDSLKQADRMRTGSLVLTSSVTLATAKLYVDACAAGKGWLKLCCHNFVTSGATGNDWLLSDFSALLDYIATKNLPVVRMADVWRTIR